MKNRMLFVVQIFAVLILATSMSALLSSCSNESSPTSSVSNVSLNNQGHLSKVLTTDHVSVNGYVYYPQPIYNRFGVIIGYNTTTWPGQSGDVIYLKRNGSTIGQATIQSDGSYGIVTAQADVADSLTLVSTLYTHGGSRVYQGQITFYHPVVLPDHDPSIIDLYTSYYGEY